MNRDSLFIKSMGWVRLLLVKKSTLQRVSLYVCAQYHLTFIVLQRYICHYIFLCMLFKDNISTHVYAYKYS